MLRLFKTFQQPGREFGYKPRFYDAEREALENRIKARENRGLNQGESTRLRLRQEFGKYKRGSGDQGGYGGVSARLQTGSTLRLLVIIVLLSWASYVVLETWLPDLLRLWFPLEYDPTVPTQEYDTFEDFN